MDGCVGVVRIYSVYEICLVERVAGRTLIYVSVFRYVSVRWCGF